MILNRFFIGLGVLALGLFIAVKGYGMFKEDHGTAKRESQVSVEQTLVLISKDSRSFGKIRNFSDLETLLGDKVVFVSTSEPAYLITEGEQRFEIGNIPGTDVQLSNITSKQLVLKQSEEVLVFPLPDASAN